MSDIRVRQQQDILWLILDHPPLNLLTQAMLIALKKAIRDALARSPRLIVITGTGEQAFCAGYDSSSNDSETLRQAAIGMGTAIEDARGRGIALVALVKGTVAGAGCELLLLCDTVLAREDVTLHLPDMVTTLFPQSLTDHLPGIVGTETAQRLLEQKRTLSAPEAMRLGLIHQVLPARRFLQDAEELLVMLATIQV